MTKNVKTETTDNRELIEEITVNPKAYKQEGDLNNDAVFLLALKNATGKRLNLPQ